LPAGYVCIADCAYQPTEHFVPIFGGNLALKKDNDNFNFFALQLQIRIEMAFGIMTQKWGILQCPLTNSLFFYKTYYLLYWTTTQLLHQRTIEN